MSNKKLRKQFDNIKRRKGYYEQFGGKKKNYQLHHPKGLSALEYVVYLFKFVHDLVHKLKRELGIEEPEWSNKAPTIEEQWEAVEISLTNKAIQEANKKAIKLEMKARGR